MLSLVSEKRGPCTGVFFHFLSQPASLGSIQKTLFSLAGRETENGCLVSCVLKGGVSSGSVRELVSKVFIHSFHVHAELFCHNTSETL